MSSQLISRREGEMGIGGHLMILVSLSIAVLIIEPFLIKYFSSMRSPRHELPAPCSSEEMLQGIASGMSVADVLDFFRKHNENGRIFYLANESDCRGTVFECIQANRLRIGGRLLRLEVCFYQGRLWKIVTADGDTMTVHDVDEMVRNGDDEVDPDFEPNSLSDECEASGTGCDEKAK